MKLTHPFVILAIASAALIVAAWQFSEWKRSPAVVEAAQIDANHRESAPTPPSSRLVERTAIATDTSKPSLNAQRSEQIESAPANAAPISGKAAPTAISGEDSGVERLVRARLKDPDSARFQNIRNVGRGEICGEVNAKNAFGGYVGFQHFWLKDADAPQPTLVIDSPSSRLAGIICDPV